MHNIYFADYILVLGPLNSAKQSKKAKHVAKWGKNTKLKILKPLMHLKNYNFINGLPEWVGQ